MFENEDFDLDEDFLKDIGEKEEEYYSQRNNGDIESNNPIKRRKVESVQSDFLNDITFDDEPDFARNTAKSIQASKESSECSDLSSRKQKILDIFKTHNSAPSQNVPRISSFDENTVKNSVPSSKTNFERNVEISRKTLALEILRKGSASFDETQSPEKPEDTSRTKSNALRQIFNAEKNTPINNSTIEIRKKSLMEIFKKPTVRNSKSPMKLDPQNSSKFASRDRSSAAPRMTLVRKFPGPAGLLPDNPDANLDSANFLNRLDDKTENEERDESELSEYYSQNTERLFSDGAWRAMLDDLPKDFLKGHEIATIKRLARNKLSCSNTRVPFLAGVIQRIDHSLENPRLELKDLSDSIEGTMHSDIPNSHPDVLEPGVVILLRNAGLLGLQGSQKCPGPHFHVMIAPKNVLAVYTEKSRLVVNPKMETLLGIEGRPEKSSGNSSNGSISETLKNKSKSEANSTEKKSVQNSAIMEDNIEINDFENDENDIEFACFNITEINDSQTVTKFSNITANIPNAELKNRKKEEEMTDVVVKEVAVKASNIISARSRLLQFKSNGVLTPPIGPEEIVEKTSSISGDVDLPKEKTRESNDANERGFGDDLLDSDNDTEDEILSQLDMDSIVTSYNSRN